MIPAQLNERIDVSYVAAKREEATRIGLEMESGFVAQTKLSDGLTKLRRNK